MFDISTHTPLAGRTDGLRFLNGGFRISTHTPLAGRTLMAEKLKKVFANFNSHAPRGAHRFTTATNTTDDIPFQLTRPSRGAPFYRPFPFRLPKFQLTRPSRGAPIYSRY